MRVYKDYYPDVIVGDVVSGRASVFTVIIFLELMKVVTEVNNSIQTKNGKKDLARFRD